MGYESEVGFLDDELGIFAWVSGLRFLMRKKMKKGCLSLWDGNGVRIEGGGGFESGEIKFVDFVFGGCEIRGVKCLGC